MSGVEWVEHPREPEDRTFGWLGGFFGAGMRWPDYIEALEADDDTRAALELIRASIIEHRIWHGGDWHQAENERGCPRLPDGRTLELSFRAWGDLLAAVWSTELDRDFGYMDFYMDLCLPPNPWMAWSDSP